MTRRAESPVKRRSPRSAAPLSAARLAAVQALYQMDMAGTDANAVVDQFIAHRLGQEVEGNRYTTADTDFFRSLVLGVVHEQRRIDPALGEHLAEGWKLSRIDSILRAILRSAAWELLERGDIPARVVINEYLDIAHAFFGGDEPKVVNGILDRLAREVRGEEIARAGDE